MDKKVNDEGTMRGCDKELFLKKEVRHRARCDMASSDNRYLLHDFGCEV